MTPSSKSAQTHFRLDVEASFALMLSTIIDIGAAVTSGVFPQAKTLISGRGLRTL
jgi:hypothetical protein